MAALLNKYGQELKQQPEGLKGKYRRGQDMSNLVYGKIPPQAVELEEAVLGAMLLERHKQELVLEIISSPEMFYMDPHQKIYNAIIQTKHRGLPVDLLTVTDTLRTLNELEIVGGAYYLTKLTMNVVSSAHTEGHARIVMEKYLAREQIRLGADMVQRGYDDEMDVFDAMEQAEEQLYELAHMGIKRDVEHIGKAALEVGEDMRRQALDDSVITGLATGWHEIDICTTGLQPETTVVVAARPGVGKTAWALNLVRNVATRGKKGKPAACAFFSLEMSKKELIKRFISEVASVDLKHVQVPALRTEDEKLAILEALHTIAHLPVYIDDTAGLTVAELRRKCRRLVAKHGVELVVIDYLQLLVGDAASRWNREQEISKISRDLKALAKELGITIVPLAQINRDIEKSMDKSGGMREPQLSDLRESGSIEQDADLVGFLYRPTKQEVKEKPHLRGTGMFYLRKNRHGTTDDFLLMADMAVQRWYDMPPAEFKSFADAAKKQAVAHIPGAGMAAADTGGAWVNTSGNNGQDVGADDLPF